METSIRSSIIQLKIAGLLLGVIFFVPVQAQVVPLPHAHAHNDYNHPRPLLNALSHGFTSIEADVLLIDGNLYVGHDMPEETHELPTLKETYLEPLARIVDEQRGQVYPGYDGDFYLMIDIKTEAEATYRVLKEQLSDYGQMLSTYQNGQYSPGAVTVFVSGNRPLATIRNASARRAALDGRPTDLGKGYSAELMPVISEYYYKVIDWNGQGPIHEEDFQKLKELSDRTHAEGKKLRLWAAPDHERTWRTLLSAGVDLINTDRLAALELYFRNTDGEQ